MFHGGFVRGPPDIGIMPGAQKNDAKQEVNEASDRSKPSGFENNHNDIVT